MNVLIVGSGGREHALAWKLSQSPRVSNLLALPGSAGIGRHARCVAGDPLDVPAVVRLCRESGVGLVVVGPEAPLAAGLSDALEAAGIRAFGPKQAAARLESSKAFAKDFMRRYSVPTAGYETYDQPSAALDAAAELKLPIVVKADGLAAGKGVRVCFSRREAIEAVQDFMVKRQLGASGSRLVLEEYLAGSELTVMALCDGRSLKTLPFSRDHKRLQDRDHGPNTGGMGAFAPVAVPPETARRIQTEILDRVLAGLAAEKMDYCGALYFGLMLTESGPKALEFNVRFGDPETQAVLPLLETDLLDLIEATTEGRLEETPLRVRPGHALTVVLASEGYPSVSKTHRPITGVEAAARMAGVALFHAGTSQGADGAWLTAGGRVLNVTATGDTLAQARARAYAAAGSISFEGMQYRTDIAEEAPVKAANP